MRIGDVRYVLQRPSVPRVMAAVAVRKCHIIGFWCQGGRGQLLRVIFTVCADVCPIHGVWGLEFCVGACWSCQLGCFVCNITTPLKLGRCQASIPRCINSPTTGELSPHDTKSRAFDMYSGLYKACACHDHMVQKVSRMSSSADLAPAASRQPFRRMRQHSALVPKETEL
jgi:hypothetical protein